MRREEWLLLSVLLVSAGLCLAAGAGFSFWRVLYQYFFWFAPRVLAVFLLTRLLYAAAQHWTPTAPWATRVRDWLFGAGPGRADVLATDLEVVRGLAAFLVTLSVYTNIKTRLPRMNSLDGDPFFQKLDHWTFGTELFPWLERTVAASEPLRGFLESIYFHGYVYMVLLVFVFYLRRDRIGIRWTFSAVSFTYILGVMMTAAYPTLGPCFVDPASYTWVRELMPEVGRVQKELWLVHHHVAQSTGPMPSQAFFGIAAFPSLHVGHMVVLFVISAKLCRLYAPLMLAMAFLTFVAMMAFGWHYAWDGFGGIALAILVARWVGAEILRDPHREH